MSVGLNDALSKLYLKLGGNPQDIRENKSITDYIDDLGDVLKSLAELPGVSSSDNGKILKVIDGTWAKGDVPNELPVVSSTDNGKFLGVSEGSWGKVDAPTELPKVTSKDNGKVLTVSSGYWTKEELPTPESYPKYIITLSEMGSGNYTIDKTISAIKTAYSDGKRIELKIGTVTTSSLQDYSNSIIELSMIEQSSNEPAKFIFIGSRSTGSSSWSNIRVSLASGGSIFVSVT